MPTTIRYSVKDMEKNPIIVIDTREQTPLVFEQSEAGTLYSGDYSYKGGETSFAVERKSLDDLVGSVIQNRDRFANECHRLRGYRFKRLLITADIKDLLNHEYHSKAEPKAVMHTLYAFEMRYDLPFIFVADLEKCSKLIERWAFWYAREQFLSLPRD